MMEFEMKEQEMAPSKVPFLMNVKMFRQQIELIKPEMK